jgi:hypothetical protein
VRVESVGARSRLAAPLAQKGIQRHTRQFGGIFLSAVLDEGIRIGEESE